MSSAEVPDWIIPLYFKIYCVIILLGGGLQVITKTSPCVTEPLESSVSLILAKNENNTKLKTEEIILW